MPAPYSNIRSESCSSCPYRCDVPSGIWAAHTYDMLPPYDAPTGSQPMAGFVCHATPDHYCHGWAVVGQNQGHDRQLLALRLYPPANGQLRFGSVPLFASHTAAADHGKADVDDPSPEAIAAIDRLLSRYERLREANQ